MRAALRYPLRGDVEDRYLAGWILHLVHAILVPYLPLVLVLGYLAGVTRAAAAGEDPPGFRDWRRVVDDTGRAVVVAAAYAVPVAAVLALGAVVLPTGTDVPAAPVILLATGLLGLLLPPLYAFPASLAHATREESVRAGFNRERVGETARTAGYFTHWAAGVSALAVGAGFVAVLGPYLVGYLLAFYCEVLAFSLFGRGAGGTLDRPDADSLH